MAGIVHHSLCHPDLCNGTLLLPVSYNQVRRESRENPCVCVAQQVRWVFFEIDVAMQALHGAATRAPSLLRKHREHAPCMREPSGGGGFRAPRSLSDAPSLPRGGRGRTQRSALPARNQELRGGELSQFPAPSTRSRSSSPSEEGEVHSGSSLVRRDAQYKPSCL